jgi:ABC-2 type transport system ATP-binding protein
MQHEFERARSIGLALPESGLGPGIDTDNCKMNSYLRISGLTKRYGAICALAGIDLAIESGSVLALLGPNGAGKSTLFGCLLGLTWPNAGTIQLHGRLIEDADRLGIGYVAERDSLYPHRTVAENATFFAALKGYSAADADLQLQRVGLLAARDRKVRQLSRGMLQRLSLAIALCGQPELLVLDEPFNGLDPAVLDILQSILREENERGTTLLISTHTMSAVEPLASHVAILLHGRLAAFGSLDDLRAGSTAGDSLETIYHRIARSRPEVELCI